MPEYNPDIPFLSLKAVNAAYESSLSQAVGRVVTSGWYLQGEENRKFEEEYASYIGTGYAVGCGNGLEALILILRGYIELGRLNPGDEVIVPANTYVASILAISEVGLVPVLVEPDPGTLQIDARNLEGVLTPKTRAVMIVHLYGRCAYNDAIARFCKDNGLLLIEDNAQAHGCQWHGKRTGSLGDAAGHSFYPGKNLGALGDAGAVTTSDAELAAIVRTLANYGSEKKYVFDYRGYNSRLDEIQAAALRVKLPYLDRDNDHRRAIARIYREGINNPVVSLPAPADADEENVYHIFPIFCNYRDELQSYLREQGIMTLIHYPIPPHKQKCYGELNHLSFPVTERIHATELSLPMSQVMTEEEAHRVVKAVNSFKPIVPEGSSPAVI